MFFRFYHHPGLNLAQAQKETLRKELLEIARTSLNPVPNYQCLSSRADALDDKLIVVAYSAADKSPANGQNGDHEGNDHRAVAFTSALYLDIPGVAHPVLHAGLTVAVPSQRRTGILAQLFIEFFKNVLPQHPRGLWFTTLAGVLSSLVQFENALGNTYPSPPHRRTKSSPKGEHLAIGRTIDERYRSTLIISPAAEWDEENFVFRGSMDWDAAACFMKDVDDASFWHRDKEANGFFRGLIRPGMGDEVLLVGFLDMRSFQIALEGRQKQKSLL